MPKKTFLYKGDEYSSAGIIFFRYNSKKNEPEYLLQKKYNENKGKYYYEDLGGKAKYEDNNIFSVAIREAAEESNYEILEYGVNYSDYYDKKLASQIYISKLMNENSLVIHNKKSKYILVLVELNDHQNYNFGDKEYESNKNRQIVWLSNSDILNTECDNFNPRMRFFKYML